MSNACWTFRARARSTWTYAAATWNADAGPAQDLRLRLDDYRRLQERLPKYVGTLQAESAWVQQATAGDVSNFATREHLASYAFLRVEPDGRVWHGWSDAPAELGDLRTPLPTIVARYLTTPATEPQVLRLRDPAALRSLADRFGEGASDVVYSGRSIVAAWVGRYRQEPADMGHS